jgi:hypothetical protein
MTDPAPEKSTPQNQNMEEILREVRRIIAENDSERSRQARELPETRPESAPAAEATSPTERLFDPAELRRARDARLEEVRATLAARALDATMPVERSKAFKFSAVVTIVAAVCSIAGGCFVIGFAEFIQLRLIFGGFLIGAGIQACMLVLRIVRERGAAGREKSAAPTFHMVPDWYAPAKQAPRQKVSY